MVGIEAIQYYLIFIIEESGVDNPMMQSLVLIFLGGFKSIFILTAGSMFDKRGRRPFLLVSVGGKTFLFIYAKLHMFASNKMFFTLWH